MKAELKRDKKVTVKLTEAERKNLLEMAKQRKTTPSGILRAALAALKEKPDPDRATGEDVRQLRNTVIWVAPLVKASPKGEDALIRALDNISRARL